MKLYCNGTSPYGRKVRIVLMRIGMDKAIEMVEPDLSDENGPLRQINPLGKMPCLVLDSGLAVFDSPVIMDFLDREYTVGLTPQDSEGRTAALIDQALADGIIDAAIAITVESFFRPPEQVSEKWVGHQLGKVERGLERFAVAAPDPGELCLGSISLACALGYLDWRPHLEWRQRFAPLAAWLDDFAAANPEFAKTAK